MSCWQLHKWIWSLKEICGLETWIWESLTYRWLNIEVKRVNEITQGTTVAWEKNRTMDDTKFKSIEEMKNPEAETKNKRNKKRTGGEYCHRSQRVKRKGEWSAEVTVAERSRETSEPWRFQGTWQLEQWLPVPKQFQASGGTNVSLQWIQKQMWDRKERKQR